MRDYDLIDTLGAAEIRRYAGSLGYQVWARGVWVGFWPSLDSAVYFLHKHA